MALFTDSQLAAIQAVGLQGMTTPVTIQRRVVTENADGDDQVDFATIGTAKGWFFSTPTPVQVMDAAALVTSNTYRLFLPVGTDVKPGDRVLVGADTYAVSDTTFESTWKALLACSLRKRE